MTEYVKENRELWARRIWHFQISQLDPLPARKIFRPKFNLPVLDSYREHAPAWYWSNFPSNLVYPGKSMVDILHDLNDGADIGCKHPFRQPSVSTNAPSSYEFGPHVSDAIADWLKKGFAYGPVSLD